MELFMSLASFVLSVIIIYYVVRKATRADEIVELQKIMINTLRPKLESVVTEEKDGGMHIKIVAKSDDEYLREARAKAGCDL